MAAPHVLQFHKGASLIDLADSGVFLADYTPKSPQISTIEAVSEIEDGGERIRTTRRNVSETIRVTVVPTAGQTMADAQAKIELIETWLRLAEEHQEDNAADGVYLEFQPKDTTDIYRSEVLGGKVVLSQNGLDAWVRSKTVEIQIEITRRWFWERRDEIELALVSFANVTPVTGGVSIHCHTDTSHGNWIQTPSTTTGALPAPLRLEIKNTYNSTSRSYGFFIGQNNFAGAFTHTLEAESAAYKNAGTNTVDATSSGGNYATVSVPQTGGYILGFDLTNAQLAEYKGRYFRIFARFAGSTAGGYYMKARIIFPSGTNLTPVSETSEVLLNSMYNLQEIGTLQIPPWLANETSLESVRLAIYGRCPSGTANISIDALFLMPLDGYRVLIPRGYGLAYNTIIADDGMSGSVYTYGWSGGGKTGHYLGYGRRHLLWPSTSSKIYFLWYSDTGSHGIDRTATVRAYYRPRRLTV